MTDIRLQYIHAFTDRHGRVRYYFRFKGKRWPLPAPGEPGFAAAYETLKAQTKDNAALAEVRFIPGSLGWAIEQWTISAKYRSRGDKTRSNDRRVLDELRRVYGGGLLSDLQGRHVRAIRNHMQQTFSSSTADMAISLLSLVWQHAVEHLEQDLDNNPTHGISRVHEAGEGHEPWPLELIELFAKDAPFAHVLALHLLLYTGQRRSDVVKMKWSQFDGSVISVKQQKTGEPLVVPCHTVLRGTLSQTPRQSEYILTGERGRPLKAEALSAAFRRRLAKLGVTGYSVHGLRKNAGVALADAGCDVRDIMAILGHRSVGMAMHYTKRADQRRRAHSAIEKWEQSGKPKNVACS